MRRGNKDSDKRRSIDVTVDKDNESDGEEPHAAEREPEAPVAKSKWEMGGTYRDYVVQSLLSLCNHLGFYRHVSEGEAAGQDEQRVGSPSDPRAHQKVEIFYRGIHASANVDGIRNLLIEQDDPVLRQLMIYVAKIKMVPRFLVPLFYQAKYEK
jgi:hypothetical protein